MLEVKKISKSYGNHLAVDQLSFKVEKGEIFGLLGENGAGKTTTFRIIMGLLEANSGTVTLDGKKIDYSVTDRIGFVTEERSLLTKLTVKDQIVYYGILKGMPEEEILKRLDTWLEKFGITEYKNRKIKELSKGNQQKIQFIAGVINTPELLILDEPFSGLDPINVKMFQEAILEMKERGCSIIFSSHQMEHIELFCEKLVILVHGQVVLGGYLKDIKKEYRKKNIFIQGDISVEKIKKVSGVVDVISNAEEYQVKIESDEVVDSVFQAVSKSKIRKFVVEEASLNEIFIEKVGESYDK
ncbi:MAG: ATP-binding cassette domain-containing protein [Bacilli bacterium]|nr:ATP-binding cassette domain-containing protein [Bacilli bacterium]